MNNIVNFIRSSNSFYTKLQDPDNINEVRYFIKDLEKNGTEKIENQMITITDIRAGLESLKVEVFNNNKAHKEEEKIVSLKAQMFEIEEKLSNIKNEIILELKMLIKSENNSLKDLQFLEKKIDGWNKPANVQNPKSTLPGTCRIQSSNSDNPSVIFQKFLSIFGGHTGSWPEYDHLLFIKERKKSKGQDNFIATILTLLPNLSYSDVVEHEKWYVKYLELQANVKEAIKKWKEEKIMKHKMINQINLEQKNVKSSNKVTYHSNVADKIKEWKQQQMTKRLEEYEEQKKEMQKLKAEEQKLKKIQASKKVVLNQYKNDKLKKMQISISKLEKTQSLESKRLNNDLLKFFRLQDIKFTERKKIMQLQLESKNNGGVKKLKVAKPTIDLMLKRDPNRVLQPTVIWNLHCHANNEKKAAVPCDVNSIPRLATPEWRKEL